MGAEGRVRFGALLDPVTAGFVFDYDVVFLVVDGGSTRTFIERFRSELASAQRARRPLLVAGYAGIVLERAFGGYADRADADLVCANSAADTELFQKTARLLGADPDRVMHAGLTIMPAQAAAGVRNEPPRDIVFATQNAVPATRRERLYLLSRLIEYARRHPDRRLRIKPRLQPGEKAFNAEQHPYPALLDELLDADEAPPNLQISYEPITEMFAETDLCLTVSSTAAVEAHTYGVPFNTLVDFGFRELYGLHYFMGSGRAITLDDFIEDRLGVLDPAWVADNIDGPDSPAQTILQRVRAMVAEQESEGAVAALPMNAFRRAKLRSEEFAAAVPKPPPVQLERMAIPLPQHPVKRAAVVVLAKTFRTTMRIPVLGRAIRMLIAAADMSVRS